MPIQVLPVRAICPSCRSDQTQPWHTLVAPARQKDAYRRLLTACLLVVGMVAAIWVAMPKMPMRYEEVLAVEALREEITHREEELVADETVMMKKVLDDKATEKDVVALFVVTLLPGWRDLLERHRTLNLPKGYPEQQVQLALRVYLERRVAYYESFVAAAQYPTAVNQHVVEETRSALEASLEAVKVAAQHRGSW